MPEIRTLVGERNVRNLGIVRMQDPDGTTSLTASNNSKILNAYTARDDGLWRSYGMTPRLPHGGILVGGEPWTLGGLAGFRISGGGGAAAGGVEVRHNGIVDNGPAIGPVSRVVAYDKTLGKLLVNKSIETVIDGINFQGHWHPNSDVALDVYDPTPEPDLTYPISSLLIDDEFAHENDARCPVAIEQQGHQFGMAIGKLICPSTVAFSHFRTCIDCVEDPDDDHADQLNFNRVNATRCDIFLRVRNIQSVLHSFNHIDAVLCDTVFRVEKGGKIHCGRLDMQGRTKIAVHIAGGDQVTRGYVRIDELNIDGTAEEDCLGVLIDPPSGSSQMIINIGYLHNEARDPGSGPFISIPGNFYGAVNIYGGDGLWEEMIHVEGGGTNFFPTIRVHNSRFMNGQDPANIFTDESSGKVQVDFRANYEAFIDGNSVNNGEFFDDWRQTFTFP